MTSSTRTLLSSAVLFLGLIAATRGTTKEEYCALCSDHTMCLYSGVSNVCLEGRQATGVEAAQQEEIVAVHNELRNKVAGGDEELGNPGPQPSASNMERLAWDDDLAEVAQRWADQCLFQHDSCRNDPRFYVGQNLYILYQTCTYADDSQDWTRAINSWYSEVEVFPNASVEQFTANDIAAGHYTQVVWAKTYLVGCGWRLYQSGTQCRKLYACNYGPGGNYLNQPVYEIGTPRSNCASSNPVDDNYPNLC